MNITEEQRKELVEVSKPLMQWLRKNCHPHVTAIVDSEVTMVMEGLATAHRKEWTTTSETIPG